MTIAWYDPTNHHVSTDKNDPLFTPLGQLLPLGVETTPDFGPQPGMHYGMNQDDWKDIVAAISKARDSRGIYLACRPADVFKDWFLAMGLFKPKEKNHG
jgi:hypothetical protein